MLVWSWPIVYDAGPALVQSLVIAVLGYVQSLSAVEKMKMVSGQNHLFLALNSAVTCYVEQLIWWIHKQ